MALALGLAGCGTPLLDTQYRGEPIERISGAIDWDSTEPPDAASLRLALFFNPRTLDEDDPEGWLELTASTLPVGTVSAGFEMNLFAWPQEALLAHDKSGAAAGYGVGRMLLYRDLNQDGRRQPGEPFLGIERTTAHFYLPAALPAERSPTGGALAQGLLSVNLPQRCTQPLPQTTPGTCGVPIGSRCTNDPECRGGRCLKETSFPWPSGVCVVTEPPPDGCRPGAAAYVPAPRFAANPSGVQGYYVGACTKDTDCVRPNEPFLVYECDVGMRACMPKGFPKLMLTDRLTIEPFCGQPR